MKKLKIFIAIVLAGFIVFYGFKGTNYLMKESAKAKICKMLSEQTGDKFRFIYGLDNEWSIATNIRYRGILYSDRLEKIYWSSGLEIGLETLNIGNSEIQYIADSYNSLLRQVEIDGMAENKSRELFGEKSNVYNDGMTTDHMYQNIIGNKGKSLSYDKKSGYYSTIVNVFVDDLDKLDNEDIKQKTFELAKFIYDDMNYVTALQVYVRDNKYFEDLSLVYGSIYRPFRTREDIRKIFEKIGNKEKLTEGEKVSLVRVFDKGGLDFENCYYEFYLISFNEKNEIPLKYENVLLRRKEKMGNTIYDSWRDDKRK